MNSVAKLVEWIFTFGLHVLRHPYLIKPLTKT
jgi:hypothetical protein